MNNNKENDTILEYKDGCKININKDGIISTSKCPDLELGRMDIDMLKKIKDIITEDEI